MTNHNVITIELVTTRAVSFHAAGNILKMRFRYSSGRILQLYKNKLVYKYMFVYMFGCHVSTS